MGGGDGRQIQETTAAIACDAGGEEAGDASDPPPERRGAGCNKLQ